MHRCFALFSCCLLFLGSGVARQVKVICGTDREHSKVELFLHRQAELARQVARLQATTARAPSPTSASSDVGNIAILEDSDGVVAQRNPFDLDQQTLTFTPTAPAAARYKFQVSGASYDAGAAGSGTLMALGDDDFREAPLAFSFPFFG